MVAYSDRIEARYQVGISDKMVQRELAQDRRDADAVPSDAAEALARYRDRMFGKIAEEIAVTLDGRPMELIPLRADIVRQQHAQIEFVYQVPFAPAAEPVIFVLLDGNYAAVPGHHLAAMRGRGGVQVLPAGPGRLFDRLPPIPSPTENAAEPVPSIRKIEAFICDRPPVEPEATAPSRGGAATEQRETASTAPEPFPSGVEAISGDPASDGRRADFAAAPRTHVAAPVLQRDQDAGNSTRHMLWAWAFAALAVAIACFWMRAARSPS